MNAERFLRHQLKQVRLTPDDVPESLGPLMHLIEDAYRQFDQEKETLEKALKACSAELTQRNELMHAVLMALPDAFLWITRDGVIKDCRGGLMALFGRDPHTLVTKNLAEFPDIADPETFALAMRMLDETSFFQAEYALHFADRTRHYEARFANLNAALVLVLIRDISDRTLAEQALHGTQQRLDHIIEFLPDATLVVDDEHRVIAWNRAIEGMTGVPKKEILGKSGYEYGTPFYGHPRPILLDYIGKDPSRDYPMFEPAQNNLEGLATEIFVPALYGGKGAYVWAKASALFDQDGNITGAIQTIRDITDKKLTEISTRVLYLVSTAASSPLGDKELFDKVFSILTEHLQVQIMFVSLLNLDGSTTTFPHFSRQALARHETLRHLAMLSAEARMAPAPLLRDIRPEGLENDETQPAQWFASPLRYGDQVLGSVVVSFLGNNRCCTAGDTHVLASVADHLALAISRNATEKALRRSEKKHRAIFENATEGIFQISLDHDLLSANPAMASIFGYAGVEDLMADGHGFLQRVMSSDDRVLLLSQALKLGVARNVELDALKADGNQIWISMSIRTVKRSDGSISHLEGSVRDVSMRKKAERKLAIQKGLFQQLFDNSPLGILLLGKDGAPLDINPSFTSLFGYAKSDLHSLFEMLLHPDSLDESFAFISTVLSGTSVSTETRRRTKDGRVIPVSMLGYPYELDGTISGAFFIFSDISERKNYEAQLTRQALRDNLTGLPNRVLFMDRLNQAMTRQRRNSEYRFAVLMIDLDSFKRVNDTLGHQAGDHLLQEVASRLGQCLRNVDTVARMGGDEFAVLLEDFQTNHEAITITRRILATIRSPLMILEQEVLVSASVGVVLQTERYTSPNDLLRDADISMYRSKELGKNQFKVFSKSMYEHVVQTVKLENDLRHALAGDEFVLFFQPIYALAGQRLQGFEALIRWNHPERGHLPPGAFIPVAEETGLITEIGKWVMLRGCRVLAGWHARFPGLQLDISLNLSPKDLLQASLVPVLTELLQETGLNARHIKLEITETAVMDNPEQATSKLERLQKMGFQIAMDDFGTGYSSLSYLQRLPLDILKIDRSFVQTMLENPNNLEIIKAIVGLGKILDLRIVAEGVETQEQFNTLRELGCDLAQGYFLGKPMPEEQAEELIASCGAPASA
ncbi:MAG: EAL domain-containing protein [Desulfomicrobium sp.]|nr:EAL domain-containing protein [Desulfomicrobium sp.]